MVGVSFGVMSGELSSTVSAATLVLLPRLVLLLCFQSLRERVPGGAVFVDASGDEGFHV